MQAGVKTDGPDSTGQVQDGVSRPGGDAFSDQRTRNWMTGGPAPRPADAVAICGGPQNETVGNDGEQVEPRGRGSFTRPGRGKLPPRNFCRQARFNQPRNAEGRGCKGSGRCRYCLRTSRPQTRQAVLFNGSRPSEPKTGEVYCVRTAPRGSGNGTVT